MTTEKLKPLSEHQLFVEMCQPMSPSGMPDPSVNLPVAPVAMRRMAMKTRAGEEDQNDLFDELEETTEQEEDQS